MSHTHTNDLIKETSPYLLQHAHNPVDWKAWNEETLAIAKEQSKLLIISVGYAACHWCHVMEHESFEDIEVAQVMNKHYINIKIDREERPDIDQIYMNAIQLMTGAGGWPLNVVALPDGRPVWGGTYFKKEQWINALQQIAQLYQTDSNKLNEYAIKLEEGIKSIDIVHLNEDETSFSTEFIKNTIDIWSAQFDHQYSGMTRAPKFMMPNNYHFLLRYAYQLKDQKLQQFTNHTLQQIAFGGIFDHVGGGFSRYSVDTKWHIPHFEKMLYDNAQMVSLYADAYIATKNELYKEVIVETLAFVKNELTGTEGDFYSSLDADSYNERGDLEEGAYYVWQIDKLKSILKDDFDLFSDYYNINDYGLWEDEMYVLIRQDTDESFIKKHNLMYDDLRNRKNSWKELLSKERNKRDKPRLDDKTLTSWNALMLKGYLDAYRVTGNQEYKTIAIANAEFILEKQLREDGGLNHNYKNGKSTINGFLEDYAATIEAFIALYEQTATFRWLQTARDLTNYTFDHFFDDLSKMFFFTSNLDKKLVSRSIEYRDNVIPSSNSMMAKCLFKLSRYFDNEHFSDTATQMLKNVRPDIQSYGSAYSNWLDLMLNYSESFFEIVITGEEALKKVSQFNKEFIPNKILSASIDNEYLHLHSYRHVQGQTLIYVCKDNTCKLPVSSVKESMEELNP